MTRFMPSLFNDNLFDHVFDNSFFNHSDLLSTDISEKDGNYLMEINLPGYNKEDIHLNLKNGYLTISGSTNNSKEEKDDKGNLIRSERYMGSVSRSYYVGEGITNEDIKAKYENGVLKVVLPSNKEIESNETPIMIE